MTAIPEGPQEPYMTPELSSEIKRALEGESNDAEHDALASVADHFGISWTSPYADEDGNVIALPDPMLRAADDDGRGRGDS